MGECFSQMSTKISDRDLTGVCLSRVPVVVVSARRELTVFHKLYFNISLCTTTNPFPGRDSCQMKTPPFINSWIHFC